MRLYDVCLPDFYDLLAAYLLAAHHPLRRSSPSGSTRSHSTQNCARRRRRSSRNCRRAGSSASRYNTEVKVRWPCVRCLRCVYLCARESRCSVSAIVAHNACQRVIPLEEVSAIEKRNSSMVLPNAIQIYTRTNKVQMTHGRPHNATRAE